MRRTGNSCAPPSGSIVQTSGELHSVATPEGVVEYSWERGLLKTLTLKDTNNQVLKSFRYEYNLANELEKVINTTNPQEVEEVRYVREAGTGRLREVVYGNGTKVAYAYEPNYADRVQSLTWYAGATPFRKEVYRYDALGRIERKAEHLPNAQGQLTQVAEVVYTYDHQGQLIREARTGSARRTRWRILTTRLGTD
ncbi:MAG: hypothetical protein KatS3mg017_0131 [Fimbriimonadales bacterium]|nr:MAG: hypothetical protein KatS3mg017_0131 [Fimbriimonadales bacterium]